MGWVGFCLCLGGCGSESPPMAAAPAQTTPAPKPAPAKINGKAVSGVPGGKGGPD